MGGGIFALHLPRQPRQVIQQRRLGIAIRLADGIGQLSQFFFCSAQHTGGLARSRQAQQGSHAVGFNLQQALHQTAHPACADAV